MKKIEFLFEKTEKTFFVISQIAVLIMMFLTTLDVAFRYVLNSPILGAFEFTERYLMVITAFLGMSYLMKKKGHIRIDFLRERFQFPSKLNEILEMLFSIFGFLFFAGISYKSMTATYDSFINGYTSTGLVQLPLWTSLIWVFLGSTIFAIRLFIEFIKNVYSIFIPNNK